MIRHIRLLARRFATALSVVAALAFAADNALGADHHLPAAAGGHHHAHAHSHDTAGAAHHEIAGADIDLAATVDGSAPVSGLDADINCCFCASCSVIVLPGLSVQAVPFALLQIRTMPHQDDGEGIVPDGLRRPPRPAAIT